MLPATRGAPFLDPKFAQEHDERISFGHKARVQQPARAGNQRPGRLPAGSPRARARIQLKSARASSQISEFRSCMHSVSWIHARAGGWVPAHAILWARLPGRGGPPNSFEKTAERKLKCTRRLRSMASGCARVVKVVCKTAESLGRGAPPLPATYIPLSCKFWF